MPHSSPNPTRIRDELRDRLKRNRFTHAVTLATNAPGTSLSRMHDLLKIWDQRMNRFLIGPKWQARPDVRMVWFAFLELPKTNPHWHLIVEADQLETAAQRSRLVDFGLEAERTWCKLTPRGSVDVGPFRDTGAVDYATKNLRSDDDLAMMRSSLDFIRA